MSARIVSSVITNFLLSNYYNGALKQSENRNNLALKYVEETCLLLENLNILFEVVTSYQKIYKLADYAIF